MIIDGASRYFTFKNKKTHPIHRKAVTRNISKAKRLFEALLIKYPEPVLQSDLLKNTGFSKFDLQIAINQATFLCSIYETEINGKHAFGLLNTKWTCP